MATPQADYSLSSTPTTLTLIAGGAGQQLTVSATPANGFTAAVTVVLTGLPSGVTAQPSTLTLTPRIAQNITVTAGTAAVAGGATLTLTGASGALSHTATVAASISAPPADFSLAVSPASLTIVSGTAGTPVSVTASAVNGFISPVVVALTGLPAGVMATPSTLTFTQGASQSTILSAALTSGGATATVTFTGTSGSLSHSVTLALTVQSAPTTNAHDVTTFHYDVARDGLNAQESILSQVNVNSTQFGKIAFDAVDGKVDAQPLYVANVPVAGQFHNILYVMTEHGSVYAFDADSNMQLWKTSIVPNGETTSDDHNCNQIASEIGITSTPVIDRTHGTNGTIFVVGMSMEASGVYHQRLHALDITTGAEVSGSPTEIAGKYPGTGNNSQGGNVVFDPSQYAERAALLLLNGNIYTAWTSHCDIGLYTGWVIAYSESTLQQTQILNLTPNGRMGSIWMAGDGLAADSMGSIYLLDANGTFDGTVDTNGFPTKGDYGNAMIKLSTSGKLAVADYFAAYNTMSQSDADLDLGSGGELLLPDQKDAVGVVHHLMVGAGKDNTIYLADRDNLGKFIAGMTPTNSNVYQQISGELAGPVFSTPAFFNGVLYYGAVGDTLKAFPMMNAKLASTPSSRSATTFAFPGTTPTISANGILNGIVWALQSAQTSPAVLHAYDPADLSREFYNSNQAANGRDSFGNGNKFITPMVANGRIYVGTQTGVAVFGLLPQ